MNNFTGLGKNFSRRHIENIFSFIIIVTITIITIIICICFFQKNGIWYFVQMSPAREKLRKLISICYLLNKPRGLMKVNKSPMQLEQINESGSSRAPSQVGPGSTRPRPCMGVPGMGGRIVRLEGGCICMFICPVLSIWWDWLHTWIFQQP